MDTKRVTHQIPFNKASALGNELAYIAEVLENSHLAGDGAFTKKCHQLLETVLGVPKVLLTTSCTHALELSALLLNLDRGDEVIVPSFAFVTTANAFALRGARPVFADVRPDTLNIDETQIERLISPHTKAIVVLHYAGVACAMDAILALAQRYGIPVIEDNAHGLFGTYRGQELGTLGILAAQSFHETKNFTSGEGGALVINDPKYIERAEILREKGTNRSRFFRGQVDKYTWVDLGSSYLPSEILAAFLYAQFEQRALIQAKRQAIWERYFIGLQDWASQFRIGLPHVPSDCHQAYHLFYLLLPSFDARQALIAHLKQRGIASAFHYLPLNLSDMGQHFGGKPGDCPVTEDISDRLLRLPFHNQLGPSDQDYILDTVRSFHVNS